MLQEWWPDEVIDDECENIVFNKIDVWSQSNNELVYYAEPTLVPNKYDAGVGWPWIMWWELFSRPRRVLPVMCKKP